MRTAIVATLVALLLAGCSPAVTASNPGTATAELPTPTIGLTYIPNVQFSPFYLAETDGGFTAAGVQPTLRHHGTSEGLFTALVAGQEQFVIAGGDELAQAKAQGLDLVAVSAYYHSYPAVVIVPDGSAIASLADLKGHTIGIPGKYGESWFALLVALRTAGLSQADVEILEIGYTQQAALTTKKVDAIVGFSNNEAVQFGLAGFATRSLAIAEGSVPLVSISLITTPAYAAANPGVVRSVIAGMLTGMRTAVSDPERALTVTADYVPGLSGQALDAARATLAATSKLWVDASGKVSGTQDADTWTQMIEFMSGHDLLGGSVDASVAMTNEFLPE